MRAIRPEAQEPAHSAAVDTADRRDAISGAPNPRAGHAKRAAHRDRRRYAVVPRRRPSPSLRNLIAPEAHAIGARCLVGAERFQCAPAAGCGGTGTRPGAHQALDLSGRDRTAEETALSRIETDSSDELEYLARLDALGTDAQLQGMGQLRNRLHDEH